MSLTCDEAREILWPLERLRRVDWREEEARKHLAACEECRRFFARDAQLTRALRAGIGAAKAPRALRERVFDALARERTLRAAPKTDEAPEADRSERSAGRRSARPAWRAAAVAAALLLGAISFWPRPGGPGGEVSLTDADEYVDDYMRIAALDLAAPAALDSIAIGRFYMRQLGRRIVPVSLENARVVRFLICQVEGRRGAMIEYEMNGTRLAHYRMPLARRGAPPSDVVLASEMGVQVARWKDGEYEHALVSEMPEASLEDLVSARFVAQ